ncbi:MAG: dipeptidase [Chloroflexi bacterium]|nr:dipeptidase [Chloroflexota bacterium]
MPFLIALFLILLLVITVTFFLKGVVNPVRLDPRSDPTLEAFEFHKELWIADMHADSLLYRNDLLVRSKQGHIDLPRLIEGNVALQVFTCVSKFPINANINQSSAGGDLVTPLAVLQGWPRPAWNSLFERALFQAGKLQKTVGNSAGRLQILRNQKDLLDFIAVRSRQSDRVAAILGLEGGHCLEGKIGNLERLFNAGYRLMSPTHFFDNELGGSLHGIEKQGLTPFGREVIRRMQELDMIIDLAHVSERMTHEILDLVARPVMLSHTGVRGICNNNRNLSDELILRIARNGGIIGIGFWDTATGSADVSGIVRSIRYTVDLAGVEHVGMGSDFDGFVRTPFDVSRISQLTGCLMAEGFSPEEIRAIMGENFLRLLSSWLPKGGPPF